MEETSEFGIPTERRPTFNVGNFDADAPAGKHMKHIELPRCVVDKGLAQQHPNLRLNRCDQITGESLALSRCPAAGHQRKGP